MRFLLPSYKSKVFQFYLRKDRNTEQLTQNTTDITTGEGACVSNCPFTFGGVSSVFCEKHCSKNQQVKKVFVNLQVFTVHSSADISEICVRLFVCI